MKKKFSFLPVIAALLPLNLVCYAGINPITVTYNSGNTSFSTASSGTANYVIHVNSAVTPQTSLLFHLSNTGASSGLIAQQITTGNSTCTDVGSLCGSSFSLRSGESCCLAFSLTSTTHGNYNLQPTISTTPATYSAKAPSILPISIVTNTTPMLSVSQSHLALSLNGETSTHEITGKPRVIVVSNSSDVPVTGLNITEPTWPSGTAMSTTCGSILAPNNDCYITITPGQTATDNCTTGTTPTPSVITLSADGITPIAVDAVILGYGCIYQEGYLFSIDDTTVSTKSIGGTVAALENQTSTTVWGSNGLDSSSVSYDIIPGIGNDSTTNSGSPTFGEFATYFHSTYTGTLDLTPGDFNSCNGKTDGRCNTANIVTFYNYYQTNYNVSTNPPYQPTIAPTLKSYYAAGVCDDFNSGHYQDWYLPAVCEVAFDNSEFRPQTPGCGPQENPLMQNIVQNLFLNNLGQITAPSNFWTSTEYMYNNPEIYAWNELMWYPPFPGGGDKSDQAGFRCVRALTD